MDLDSPSWRSLYGGNKIPYNASLPLKKLRDAVKPEEVSVILDALKENLHHNGDVGTASYAAIPQLVAICITKRSFDSRYIGLCLLIELCRIEKHNPEVPEDLQGSYFDSLSQLERYLLLNFKNITDQTSLRLTLALLATLNGQPHLGKSIELLTK
ncbi:MAG: hypothetical protein H7Y42_12400 [Chitinophagaceae bacterium]|nr:hypothetical protein [Chitinophagaceae bacterium]